MILYTILNDKYFKKYINLFNFSNNKYTLIINNILFNYTSICKIKINNEILKIYAEIIYKNKNIYKNVYNYLFFYNYLILINLFKNNKNSKNLIISNTKLIVNSIYEYYKDKVDVILYYNNMNDPKTKNIFLIEYSEQILKKQKLF